MNELTALKQQLSTDQTASYYSEQFFSNLSSNKEAEKVLGDIIKNTIQRYRYVDEIKERFDNEENYNQLLLIIFRKFPSFGFIVCNEMDKRPDFYDFTKTLRIANAVSTIARKVDYKVNADLFLNQLDANSELVALEEKLLESSSKDTYIPRIVNSDFVQLVNTHPTLQSTTNPHELIEIIYYYKAVKQIFLKYYFYLIGYSQSDILAAHVSQVFSRLLISLRSHEIRFWKKYKNGKKLQLQLENTISKDLEISRHPHLRKHIFERIDNFNPVIQDGGVRNTVIEVRDLQMKQLAVFYELSINKLVMLLDTTLKIEGPPYVTYLLSQLHRTDNEKLFILYDHLKKLSSEKTKSLRHLVMSYAHRLPRSKRKLLLSKGDKSILETVYKTAESLRQESAHKRLVESEGKRGMTQDQVPRFLEERLKKLYERVKIEGALTQDQIPEYLAKFAAAAEMVMGPVSIGSQQVVFEEFKNTTDEILEDISSKGQLSAEEIEEYKENIEEKTNELKNKTEEERTDIVDEIGVTLTEASFESDKRKEEAEREAFFKKSIIPYGLEKRAKRVSITEFFIFPFGDFNGPDEDDWFDYHMRYLQLAVKEKKFDKSNFVKIFNSLSYLPRIKYKKYFNIFPNDQFEETTFMAVYDLWQNKAFDRLKIE
ncbi:hypothetical protein KJ966_26375 [bacterium]|nr:hypothetical protein [bacterium]